MENSVLVTIPTDGSQTELFDDCEICQYVKRQQELGKQLEMKKLLQMMKKQKRG